MTSKTHRNDAVWKSLTTTHDMKCDMTWNNGFELEIAGFHCHAINNKLETTPWEK